ncbi:hypothetical protein PQX77_013586 [Marasmius sp. AFHP31]|nr:hypothetical protein PQX77_013586 [Marasmius sp. AFHP31]
MSSSPPSPSLDEEQVELLKSFWRQTISQYLVFGIQATLFVITVYILASQGLRRSKARTVLLCITCVMFANSLIGNSIISHSQMGFFESLSPNPKPENEELGTRLTIVANTMLRINWVLSDAIVVWRAWIFWPRNRIVQGVLSVCFIGTVGTMIADITRIALSFYDKGPPVTAGGGAVMVALPPLVTNLVATGLIGLKAWTYSRGIQPYLAEFRVEKSASVGKVMLLLIESGLFYSTLWIFILVTNLVRNDVTGEISPIVAGMSISLAGIYPMLVIILVALKKSYAETMFASHITAGVSRPIEFGERGMITSTEGTATRTPGYHDDTEKSFVEGMATTTGGERTSQWGSSIH